MKFRQDKFYEWKCNTHISEKMMDMVHFIAEEIGYGGGISRQR